MEWAWIACVGAWALLPMHSAQALMLGEVRGAAILGRPLDITVQVQRAPGEEIATECFSVDLYFAEARQQLPKVSVVSSGAAAGSVRIRSVEAVNEPVVTVLLAAACGTGAMRRYILLSDIPAVPATSPVKVALAPAPVATAVATVAPASAAQETLFLVLPEGRPASAAVVPAAPDEQPVRRTRRKPAQATPAAVSATPETSASPTSHPAQTAQPASQRKGAKGARAVLRLDPLGVFSDRVGTLDSPMSFSPTEDTLLHAKQIAVLQDEMRMLRALRSADQAQIEQLRTDLVLLQRGGAPTSLSASLSNFSGWARAALWSLLLLTVLGGAWYWRTRSGRYSAWWHGAPDFGDLATIFHPRAAEAEPFPFAGATVDTQVPQTVAEMPSGSPLESAAAPGLKPEPAPTVSPQPHSAEPTLAVARPQPPAAIEEHRLTSEYILDIRQQADFFVSLGQSERAIDILVQQIHGNPDPDPLVYLDLFGLYHSLGAKADFAMEAASFAQHFHCKLPDFAEFDAEGKGLESYPEVLSKIVRLWPNQGVMDFLDHCIYRATGNGLESFALGAFRELLTLRALAEGLSHGEGRGAETPVESMMERTIPLHVHASAERPPLDFHKAPSMPEGGMTAVQPTGSHAPAASEVHLIPAVEQAAKAARDPGLMFSLEDTPAQPLPAISHHVGGVEPEPAPEAEAPPPGLSLFAALPNSFFDVEEEPVPQAPAPADIALLFAKETADMAPTAPSSSTASLLSITQPTEETPSRMLDLDFSHLTAEAEDRVPPKPTYAQRKLR